MRILVLTHNYPRFPGDAAGAFVERLARACAADGHEVMVLAPHAPGAPRRAVDGGLVVRRFRYAPDALERVAYRGDLHATPAASLRALVGVPFFLAAFHLAAGRAARRFAPDVVHAHWWLPGGWIASKLGTPYVVTCHGSDVRILERARVVRTVGMRVLRRAAAVTTVSRFLADDVTRLVPGLPRAPIVAPMPIDVEHFLGGAKTPKAQPPRILYAGNLVASKGVADLIAAAAHLRDRHLAFQLEILGEGPDAGALRAEAQRHGLGAAITWSRFVSQESMPAEYGASTITVLPTRGQAEGLGLTLVEALLAGSAVVGTPAGGIPEVIIHEQTGLLARSADPADLAVQIERLLGDQALRARLVAAGQVRAKEMFSPRHTVSRFLSLYGDIAAHRT